MNNDQHNCKGDKVQEPDDDVKFLGTHTVFGAVAQRVEKATSNGEVIDLADEKNKAARAGLGRIHKGDIIDVEADSNVAAAGHAARCYDCLGGEVGELLPCRFEACNNFFHLKCLRKELKDRKCFAHWESFDSCHFLCPFCGPRCTKCGYIVCDLRHTGFHPGFASYQCPTCEDAFSSHEDENDGANVADDDSDFSLDKGDLGNSDDL